MITDGEGEVVFKALQPHHHHMSVTARLWRRPASLRNVCGGGSGGCGGCSSGGCGGGVGRGGSGWRKLACAVLSFYF